MPCRISVEKENEVLSYFQTEKTLDEVAAAVKLNPGTVQRVFARNKSKEELANRYSRMCRVGKLGKKNPMFGRVAEMHHRWVNETYDVHGYKWVKAPCWYTGTVDCSKALEHHVNWCLANGHTKVPDGYVIHHKDHCVTNNDATNLEMLTVGEHMRHHNKGVPRKVQRLSRKGVGNSVPEAPAPSNAG
jgi:hypothetical protein